MTSAHITAFAFLVLAILFNGYFAVLGLHLTAFFTSLILVAIAGFFATYESVSQPASAQ